MVDDREGAVREVARVYELIKTNQPLFLLHDHLGLQEPPPPPTNLAQSLLSEALRALNIALSVMKQQQQQQGTGTAAASSLAIKSEHQLSPSSPVSATADSNGPTSTSARSGKRRRPVTEGKNPSWINLTTVPYDDGYEWRKYGEKKINGTYFTRSYFRCTYKDNTGCLATKYVQQKDNSDPPVFQVTYNNDHTCNCNTNTSSPAKKNNNLPTVGAASNNPPTDHHDVMIIKQEATVVLPPLADVSAVPALDHDYVTAADAGIPSTTRSNAWDELDMGRIMMESLLMGDDPEFQDLELRLLYNSIKYY